MKLLIFLLASLLIMGCSHTTTYKAKSQGWNRIIEAKTISISDRMCENHAGYFKSSQYEIWHDYNHGNYYEYKSVEIICYDGYTETLPIETVNAEVSPRVAELLKQFEKEDNEVQK